MTTVQILIIILLSIFLIYAFVKILTRKRRPAVPYPPEPFRINRTPVFLGYSSISYNNACRNTKTKLYIETRSLSTATIIYKFPTGQTPAVDGFYSDGQDAVYWFDGTMGHRRCGQFKSN